MEIPGRFCRLVRPREIKRRHHQRGQSTQTPNLLNDGAFAWFPRTHHAMRRTSRALNRARARTFGRATRAGLGWAGLLLAYQLVPLDSHRLTD